MSQWDSLIQQILQLDKNLRFDELAKALIRIGYSQNQPSGGSSHYTFRKEGCMPVTLPKNTQMDTVYVKLVRDAVAYYLSVNETDNPDGKMQKDVDGGEEC